jgi:hypothetical protein
VGRGLLVESNDGAQPGGTFRDRSLCIGNAWSVFPMLVGTVAAHGWDAGLAAEQGEPIPKMSDKRRYKLRDEQTAEVEARLATVAWSAWDPSDQAERPGGHPVELLEELLDRSSWPLRRHRSSSVTRATCPARSRVGNATGGGAEPHWVERLVPASGSNSCVRHARPCSPSPPTSRATGDGLAS